MSLNKLSLAGTGKSLTLFCSVLPIVNVHHSHLLRHDQASKNYTLQRHFTENSKQVFPEMKLHGLISNSYIHVSVSNFNIPTIGLPFLL
jgi:hypothetical protein